MTEPFEPAALSVLSVLSVTVDAVPEPGLLRPAVEAALAGRPWPAGPEATVAEAVRAAVLRTRPGDGAGQGRSAADGHTP